MLIEAFPNIAILPHKIVSGELAVEGELPFQVFLRNHSGHDCGGSIVFVNGVQIILTAARCVTGKILFKNLTLFAGTLYIVPR